jgi:hypothetical protein
LAAPPARGQLQAQLQELAAQKWRHPVSGAWVVFGRSTIERWYYKALRAKAGPVAALTRKIRSDHGLHPSVQPKLVELLTQQHCAHPSWSYQLHFDNLAVLVEQEPQAGPLPSYVSLLRWMKSHGLFKRARRGPVHSPGAQAAEHRYQAREVRSYESEYVNGLWHLDFHHGSLRVLLNEGRWTYPILLGVLDDHSRLCCHLQWYLAEGARELCHGLGQAFQKRDLPRALLVDYVPRNIIKLLCPAALCGQHENPAANAGQTFRGWPHNFHRVLSHFSSSASSRQTERAGRVDGEFPIGGWQASNAFCFMRRLISAYRLVVSKPTCPSQARITLTSTPDSSKWVAAVCLKTWGEMFRSGRPTCALRS